MTTCVICKTGHLRDGTTSVVLTRGDSTVIVRDVPAEICDNCGEAYTSADVTDRVFRAAEDAISRGAEVEIRRYTPEAA